MIVSLVFFSPTTLKSPWGQSICICRGSAQYLLTEWKEGKKGRREDNMVKKYPFTHPFTILPTTYPSITHSLLIQPSILSIIYPSTCLPPTHLSITTHPPSHPSIHLPIHLSVHLSTHPLTHPSPYPPTHPFMHASVYHPCSQCLLSTYFVLEPMSASGVDPKFHETRVGPSNTDSPLWEIHLCHHPCITLCSPMAFPLSPLHPPTPTASLPCLQQHT